MEVFPITVNPDLGYVDAHRPVVQVQRGVGRIREVVEYADPVFRAAMTFDPRNESQVRDVLDFWKARAGPVEAFWFWTMNPERKYRITVGTGNGSNKVFYVGLRDWVPTFTPKVYVNGALQASGYTLVSGNEVAKPYRSTLTFTTAPSNGYPVEVEAVARALFVVAFTEDDLEVKKVGRGTLGFGLRVEEVLS